MAKASVQEFAAAVRQSHPEYNDVTDDHQLVDAVLKAHPEYGDDVDMRTFAPTRVLRAPSGRPAGTNPGDVAAAARASMSSRAAGGDQTGETSTEHTVLGMTPGPFSGVLGEGLIGAGKGAVSTAYHTGRLLGVKKNPDLESALEPENTAQAVGKVGEQAAEYAAGEGAVKAGVKGAGLALTLPGKVAAGAAVGGTVAKMQGGDASTGALAGAVAPVAEEGINAVAGAVKTKLVASAQQSWNRLFGATTDINKRTAAKIVPEMVDRGVVVGSRKGALEKFSAEADDFGQKIDDVWQSLPPGTAAPAKDIQAAIADAKSEFQTSAEKVRTVDPADVKPTDNVVLRRKDGTVVVSRKEVTAIEPAVVKNFDRVAAVVDAATDDVTGTVDVAKLRKVRQVWDEIVGPKGGYVGKDLSLPDRAGIIARREGANAIRTELANAIPDLAAVNKEYTFWTRAAKVMGDTVTRTSSQSQPMGEQLAKVAGTAAAGKAGIVKALITGKAAGMFRKVTTSAAWNSVSALTKSRLAKLIADGDKPGVTDLIYKVAFATGVAGQRDRNDADEANPNE